jgi:cation diffusion facilitator family transporter
MIYYQNAKNKELTPKSKRPQKSAVALSSVFASAAMTIMKFIVGMMTGSMGIISEAAHSGLDLGAALLTLFAVKAGDKPADDTHPYGHGKIESVSALIETGLLFLTSVWIVYEAVHRILAKDFEVEATWYAFAVIIISIIIDINRSRSLSKVAKETNSQALEADALHFSSDVWSSCVVLIGLTLVFFGVKGADSFAAIGVSIFVLIAGYRLGKRTINVLIDTAPEGVLEIVKEVVENIESIISVEKIRVRSLSPSIFIEVEIGISRNLSLVRVDEISQKVKMAIQQKIAGADVVIHTKLIQMKDETMIDVVKAAAAKHAYSVHGIVVDSLNDKKFISYDLELPGKLTVLEGHEIASHLEEEIRLEIGADVELSSHVDPCVVEETSSSPFSDQEIASIKKMIVELAGQVGGIKDAHNILIRKIGEKIIITLHCYTEAEKTIEEANYFASKLKNLIKERIANVHNVIVHVEPKI